MPYIDLDEWIIGGLSDFLKFSFFALEFDDLTDLYDRFEQREEGRFGICCFDNNFECAF